MVTLRTKLSQIWRLAATSRTPIPLILDSVRMFRWSYEAQGLDNNRFRLKGGQGEWFTFYENVIRRDYLQNGILVQKGDTVIDIGANIGTFTLVVASLVGPGGRVIAFEPNPSIQPRLREHVCANRLTQVTVHNDAVGGSNGTITLFVQSKSSLSTTHSTLDDSDRSDGIPVQVVVRGINEIFDGIEGEVGLLKVDCEGAEYDIFDRLSEANAGKIRQIAMEVHKIAGRTSEALISRLTSLGFDVKNSSPMTAFRRRSIGVR